MNFGLLGALGGAAGAANDIADASIREKTRAREMQELEAGRMRQEERAEGRADARETRKLAFEDQRRQKTAGLLQSALQGLPPDATPLQKAEATIGVDPEYSKGMIDLAKAQSSTEAQSERIRIAQEKINLSIERLRSGGGWGSDKTPAAVQEWQIYDQLPEDKKAEFLKFKGKDGGGNEYVPSMIKDRRAYQSMSPEEQAAYWDAAAQEEADKNLRSGAYTLHKDGKAKARQAAEDAVRAKLGDRPNTGNWLGGGSSGARPSLDSFLRK